MGTKQQFQFEAMPFVELHEWVQNAKDVFIACPDCNSESKHSISQFQEYGMCCSCLDKKVVSIDKSCEYSIDVYNAYVKAIVVDLKRLAAVSHRPLYGYLREFLTYLKNDLGLKRFKDPRLGSIYGQYFQDTEAFQLTLLDSSGCRTNHVFKDRCEAEQAMQLALIDFNWGLAGSIEPSKNSDIAKSLKDFACKNT